MPIFVFTFLIAFWELLTLFFPDLRFVVPPPHRIFSTLYQQKNSLFAHSLVTLKEMVFGFLLALGASFPLASLLLYFKKSRPILQPFFVILQCIPMFTLAPIMIFWFGWGQMAIIVPTALMIFFPLTLSIYQGLIATPLEYLEFFKTHQATKWQTFFKLRLPFARPHIFAGLKISSASAGIGAIAGEWAGGQKGLGILMLESRRNTDLEITFAALFLLAFLALMFYGFIVFLEKPKKKLLFASLTLLVSCQSPHPQTKLLLDWLPNPNHVPLYVGIEKGFFAEENINLEIQKLHESGGIAYLTSGKCDLLVCDMATTIKTYAKGAQMKIVATLIDEPLNCLIYRNELTVNEPKDLSGKVLGYCLGSSDISYLDYLLNTSSIVPKEKINVEVDLVMALGTKKVDFLYGAFWNVEPFHLESLGINCKHFKLSELKVPHYKELVILSKENHPFFKKALQKSIDFCKENPEEAFEIYLRQNRDKSKKTIAWEKKSWEQTVSLFPSNQEVDPEGFERFALWLHERCGYRHLVDYKALAS